MVAPYRPLALVIEKHPIFSIRILGNTKCSNQQDGSFLEVLIQNHLPCVSREYVSVLGCADVKSLVDGSSRRSPCSSIWY